MLGLQIVLADAGGAFGQDANPMVQSIVQSVRDDVQRRIRERGATAELTAHKPVCASCARIGKRKHRRH